jgi:hypothetical protein
MRKLGTQWLEINQLQVIEQVYQLKFVPLTTTLFKVFISPILYRWTFKPMPVFVPFDSVLPSLLVFFRNSRYEDITD